MKIVKKLTRSPFSSVTAGTAIGQIAMIAALPFIARIYDAAAVGRFGVVLAGSQVVSIVVSGRVQQILPRVDESARWPITRMLLLVAILLGPPATIALFLVIGSGDVRSWASASLLVVSFGIFNVMNFVSFAQQEYRTVATMRFVNGVATAAGQVLGGLIVATDDMLICTYAFGNLVACLVTWRSLRRLRATHVGRRTTEVLRSERVGRFAATVGSTAFLSNVSLAIPVFGIAALYGEAVAGSFFLARRMLIMPIQLVASTVSDVSYSMIARSSLDVVRRHVYSWLRRLAVLAGLLVLAGAAAGPIAAWIVGPGYREVAVVVWLMTLPAAAQLVGTSMANVLLALGMELTRLVMNVVKVVALAAAFVLAGYANLSYVGGVAVLAVVLVVWYLGLLGVTLRRLGRPEELAT